MPQLSTASINPSDGVVHAMSDLLELQPAGQASVLRRVTEYVSHVEGAAAILEAALPEEAARSCRRRIPRGHRSRGWYAIAVESASDRLEWVLTTLGSRPVQGPSHLAEFLAFATLSELTTADRLLVDLGRRDWAAGVKALGTHLRLLRRQFEETAALEETLGIEAGAAVGEATNPDERTFEHARDALLERAGGAFSLTEAAQMLGISRQALHKRIAGGTALGMMDLSNEIVVPKLQIATAGEKPVILPGVDAVTKLFKKAAAGPWMALQFLVDADPNLGRTPIAALQAGAREAVVQAARAHLHLDEE